MFTVEERARVRDYIVAKAEADSRLVAAAAVGSSAGAAGDRWSDLDLSFAIGPDATVDEVLTAWTADVSRELDAALLFDVHVHSTVYRVFLLPGALQLDLSFAPVADFGALTPRFDLLFGTAAARPMPPPPGADAILGMGIHHAVRAHTCIARNRLWQAEHWISGVRSQALALACQARGLESQHGRGLDRLPASVLEPMHGALVTAITVAELQRALAVAVAGLVREAATLPGTRPWLLPELIELCGDRGTASARS